MTATSPEGLVVVPARAAQWDDLVELFGTRGDPSWCWCQFFLTTGNGHGNSASANRRALHDQVVSSRVAPGLLAYVDESPVGWVRAGPRTGFPRVCGSRAMARALSGTDGCDGIDDLGDPAVWAVTCFVVKVGRRRRGVSRALLRAAVEHARDQGAAAVVGHPVDVGARSSKVAGAELYHGVATTFTAEGFSEVARTGPSRPVMRLEL